MCMDCMMLSSWMKKQGDTVKFLRKLQRYLKWLDAADLLACVQELLDGDHSVFVLVHFLKNNKQIVQRVTKRQTGKLLVLPPSGNLK